MIVYEDLGRLNRPYLDLFLTSLAEVASRGNIIQGYEVDSFERSFATYTGAKYCVGVANGTDALTISLKYFGFSPGSEVIIPSNTYDASVIAVLTPV